MLDAVSSLANVLLWFYLGLTACLCLLIPTIENCPLIYDQWLECVTSTGSIMMPIWVLLKWFMCSFCPRTMFPRVPRRWHSGLFVEFRNFHTISSGCMLHVPNKMASQRLSMTKHLRGWLEIYILYFYSLSLTFCNFSKDFDISIMRQYQFQWRVKDI